LAERISLQRSYINIFELTDTVALLANEARFFSFRVYFQGMPCSLQNEVGNPQFFGLLAKVDHYLWESLKQNLCVGTFGRERP